MEFVREDISEDEVVRRRAAIEPLTDTVRDLIDAVIRTEVGDDVLATAQQRIAAVVDDLRARQIDGAFGVRYTPALTGMAWGNAVVGARNAIAPPLRTRRDGDAVVADFTLGAAYEGPPGHVHGGVCALILDQMLGEGASVDDAPCFTGTISVRYLRPTRLGELSARAAIASREGRKRIVRGTIADADGVTCEAEGTFVIPRRFTSDGDPASQG
ncbi:PaaI family thioesterase [Gordonia sinesedis]